MEKTLKLMILNEIDKHPAVYTKTLAEIAGFTGDSRSSNFKKVLNNEQKEFDDFNSFINLIKSIWKDDYVRFIVKYSKEIDPKKKTARNLLEFLAHNRQFEAFNNLLDGMETCTNKESNEWAKIYRMQYKYELAITLNDYNSLLREINQIHVTISELKIYKKMLMNYCFDQTKDYNMVKVLSNEIEIEVETIENEYIKEMYSIRSNEILSYNYLRVYNNTEAARNHADNIITSNASTAFKAFAYFTKGYSFLFTSHDKTIFYLNKSKELYESIGKQIDVDDLTKEIEFANVYWSKFTEKKCSFTNNQLLLDIKNGVDITLNLAAEKENIAPEFYSYLEGLNTNNDKKLMVSLIKYVKKNDLFLANLAKIELLKNGYDEEILEELTN